MPNRRQPEQNDVQRLQEQVEEQARRDREDRLAREARHRWEEKYGDLTER